MATTQTVENGNDRRIDPERIERALTDDMTVREHAPGQYLVARDGDGHEEHLVGIEAGACDCSDAHYRDVVCVHMVRASLHHLFAHGADTRLVARVAGAIADIGCPHGNDCDGPCGTGQYPCPACVRSTNTGDWTVYQRLVAREPATAVDRGEGVVTDGGRRHTLPQSTCDHETTETDYIERSDGQHKVIVCVKCNLILEDCGVPEPDVCTDGGVVQEQSSDESQTHALGELAAGLEDDAGAQLHPSVNDDGSVEMTIYPADRSRESYTQEWSEGRVVCWLREGRMQPRNGDDPADYLVDEDPAEAARDTPHGETVTLVYESARSGNEVEMEVERAHVLGTTGEFRRCDDENRPAQHRVTVGCGGTVRSHTTRSTVLGELVEVR